MGRCLPGAPLCPPGAMVPIPGIHSAPLEAGKRQREGMGGPAWSSDLPHWVSSLRAGKGEGFKESSIPHALGHSRVPPMPSAAPTVAPQPQPPEHSPSPQVTTSPIRITFRHGSPPGFPQPCTPCPPPPRMLPVGHDHGLAWPLTFCRRTTFPHTGLRTRPFLGQAVDCILYED